MPYKGLRRQVRRDLLVEAQKHSPTKLLRQIPCIGPIRAALLIALLQTPHRAIRSENAIDPLWAAATFVVDVVGKAGRIVAGVNREHGISTFAESIVRFIVRFFVLFYN
jgi:hypothetical protein